MNMFDILKGWTCQFLFNGEKVGGTLDLATDTRLGWHIENVGGVRGKTILELGALEGAHTKTLEEAGAIVTAIEGNPNNFLKCLVVKEAFDLKAKFIYGDFCESVENYSKNTLGDFSWKFDIVSAAGVLYHQKNPAKLIYDIAKITDNVIVWSQVAKMDEHRLIDFDKKVEAQGNLYYGKDNIYQARTDSYCGGLEESSFWLYAEDMRKCFTDAGFTLIETPTPPTPNGEAILFVAKK